MVDAGTPDGERRAALEARYHRASQEVARLSRPDDHGSGERTARLAALGAWEQELESARIALDQFDAGNGRTRGD